MLQQGMVVARQETATYSEVVANDVIYFLFDTVRIPVFHLSENRTPIPYTGAHG